MCKLWHIYQKSYNDVTKYSNKNNKYAKSEKEGNIKRQIWGQLFYFLRRDMACC